MLKKTYVLLTLVCVIFSCNNDDTLTPACETVNSIAANTITHNSAIITWESVNTSASYRIEYGISGFTLGSGTTISESNTETQLSNLLANTTYDIYIQTLCNTDDTSLFTDVYSFTTSTPDISATFKTNLSELNLFLGDLKELNASPKAFEYNLNTTLFSDYSHKQRLMALPEGTSMEFDGDGLPIFPDNTVIAKTFYYNLNEQNLALGRHIIETRILIKLNGIWETGNYKWNEEQTDAVLDPTGSTIPISWIDTAGNNNEINYKIPSNTDCITCHHNNDTTVPIGPKLRSMNFDIDGVNQLEQFITNQQLTGLDNSAAVRTLPNWEDDSFSLEERARAYMDINCAHCHIPGGQCEDQSPLNLAYETPLDQSYIEEQSLSIDYRISFYLDGLSMPLLGTSIVHTEGVALIQSYLNTFD